MFLVMQPLFTSIGFLLLYNETMQAELKLLARIDPLTGVNNRLALVENPVYNHCRQEILSFLYEKQRKVESLTQRATTVTSPAAMRA